MKTIGKLLVFLGIALGGSLALAAGINCWCTSGSQGDVVAACSDGSVKTFNSPGACEQFVSQLGDRRGVDVNKCHCAGSSLMCNGSFQGNYGNQNACENYLYTLKQYRR